jgi:prolyl-tRNA synthetase
MKNLINVIKLEKLEKMGKNKTQELSITVKKEENLSDWYTQVIIKADLIDYTKVSGCIVYKPSSYQIWEKIKDFVDFRFKKIGIKNAYFPLFIPYSLLAKEEEHVEGFTPEVAWVTETGDTKLSEKLAVRPTSETIMYDSYSKWIKSYRDLPLRLNQWNNVVRWEFKHSTPFLRSREFLWNEGHTVFANKEEAEAERDVILDIYQETLKDLLALYSIRGQKSEEEKFAGAEGTFSLECFLPTGQAIQGPDFHLDGQNFAKAFDIKFTDEKGEMKYAYQNTFAITTRMLGVMIMAHSDNKGLVLPPSLAENKVVIVPLLFKGKEKEVLEKANDIKNILGEKNNAFVDERDNVSAGFKFNEWEIKGIPIRIEIGPRDIENNQVIVVKRNTGEKIIIKLDKLQLEIPKLLEQIQNEMYEKSKEFTLNKIKTCDTEKEFEKNLKDENWPLTQWCGTQECEERIKEKYSAKSNNIPFVQPKKATGKCVFCDKKARYYALIAKSL